jgi:hypothetical protein
LNGNIVDPLGDVLMKLFPDGFVTALPAAPPNPTVEELEAAVFPAGGLDMEGAAGSGAAITAWEHTLERASARIDEVIVIFMMSSPEFLRRQSEMISSRSRTIFHGSVPAT